jgi:signal transduction histidine kinase
MYYLTLIPFLKRPALFRSRTRKIGVISIILVIIFSFSLFFYVQNLTQNSIRTSVFAQQKERQIEATKSISEHIGSDLNLVVGMLDGLANSYYLQRGDLSSQNAENLIKEKYTQYGTIINRLFVLNKDNIVTISLSQPGSETFLSQDFSLRDWVKETRNSLEPVFSDGFERLGIYRIFIAYPIINRNTHEFIGMLTASIPTVSFFAHYANVQDINSQFLVAYNRKGTVLANGASKSLLGENFFGVTSQNFINHNKILNNLTQNLFEGHPAYGVYDYGRGEKLTTQYPILVNNKPIYFIQLVTPTSQIYSQVNTALSSERTILFLLLASTISAVAALTVFLIKWNSILDKQVRTRTKELHESNKQLKLQHKMQQEFINVAAHELRTPIQPILSLSQVLSTRIANWDKQYTDYLEIIVRNAKRLYKLSEDILDVTKIEGQFLKLNRERIKLEDLVSDSIEDYRNQIKKHGKASEIELILKNDHDHNDESDGCDRDTIFIEGDRSRLIQTISNLLDNAFKFTNEGSIYVTIKKEHNQFTISMKDTGQGIDPEILPKLFSKFASKSHHGTGLGLFICKSIIEAHGGIIWAENNTDIKGATFYFSLPFVRIDQKKLEQKEELQKLSRQMHSH